MKIIWGGGRLGMTQNAPILLYFFGSLRTGKTILVEEILIRNGRRIYFAVLESILTAIYV